MISHQRSGLLVRAYGKRICCTGACLWYASMRGTCIVCARVSVQTCAHVKIKFQEKNGTCHVFYPIAIVCWFCVFAVNYVFVYNLYITVCVCMYLYVVVYPFVTGRYSCVTRMYSYVARMYSYVTQMYSYVFVCYSHVVLVTIIVSMPLISMRRRITDENKQGWLNSVEIYFLLLFPYCLISLASSVIRLLFNQLLQQEDPVLLFCHGGPCKINLYEHHLFRSAIWTSSSAAILSRLWSLFVIILFSRVWW